MKKIAKTLVTLLHYLGANKIQWAHMIILEKDYMFFFPKKHFFIWMNFGTISLQLFIINAYSCPITQHVFFIIFLKIWILENVLIPCKFIVLFFKMVIISNHNQVLVFYMFMLSCIINYNFLNTSCTFYPYTCGKGLLKF
jgi:hypothetical protein